jgi:hypothetical protein
MTTCDTRLVAPRFTLDDAERAGDEWGANCGPAALAMVAGLSLDEVRPHMGDFEQKGYVNPTLMFDSLRRIGVRWQCGAVQRSSENQGMLAFPDFGLARVQWEGPWTAPGVPIRVRYRHTHWVGAMRVEGKEVNIFDINCMCVGGWVPLSEWSSSVAPWILKQCEPKASGRWHLTHVIEVTQ